MQSKGPAATRARAEDQTDSAELESEYRLEEGVKLGPPSGGVGLSKDTVARTIWMPANKILATARMLNPWLPTRRSVRTTVDGNRKKENSERPFCSRRPQSREPLLASTRFTVTAIALKWRRPLLTLLLLYVPETRNIAICSVAFATPRVFLRPLHPT